MTARGRSQIQVGIAIIAGLLIAAPPAHARWTEHGVTIARLDEVLPGLRAPGGARMQTSLPPDSPVVLPEDAELAGPGGISLALVESGYVLRPGSGVWTIASAGPHSDFERAKPRLHALSIVAPLGMDLNTVQSGAVALFGQLLGPPFKVERVGDNIQINHVVVYPPPGIDVAPPQASPAQTEEHTRIQRAMADYPVLRARVGDDAARAQLRADLLSLPGIARAEWVDATNLRMVRANGVTEDLSFDEENGAEPETPDELHQRLDSMVAGLDGILKGGGAIVCGATYLLTLPGGDGAAFRARVAEIRALSEPEALKLARIQAWTGHRSAAADLLFPR